MTSELEKSYSFCRGLARRKAKNFYYAFIFLPKEKRDSIYALYAFCQFGDSLADEADNIDSLQSLRFGLQNCLRGKFDQLFFPALGDSITRFNLPIKLFEELIDGMESDLNFSGFDNFLQLENYCYKVASVVGLICIEIFGYKDPKVKDYAYNLGIALQLTNIIRDFGEDLHRGRIYFPREYLLAAGYSGNESKFDKDSAEFRKLMENMYRKALEFYDRANESLPTAEIKNQIASEIMKSIYFALLGKIRRLNFPVMEKRISLSLMQKLTIALKTFIKVKFAR